MSKQQYVCNAVYSPLANAIADCQICGWEISRHKTKDSTGKGPFGPDAVTEAVRLLRILREDYGKGGEKYRAITAWLNLHEPSSMQTSEQS